MQAALERSRLVARERNTQRVRCAGSLAGAQHALYRGLLLGERSLERGALPGYARRFGAQLSALGFEPRQPAIGLGDRTLGVAQGVARLPARRFLLVELTGKGFDAAAQCLQVLLPVGAVGAQRGRGSDEEGRGSQALAFPCAETAAIRFSISAGSPR
jgi:hypothetical protein